jgi:transcription initiation factor TFIIE subunit alpha
LVDLDDPVIRGLLFNLVGEEGIKVVVEMPDGEITDEKVAEVTNVPLNVVRRTLYILFENRLAFYRRERNKDSGWLTYLWKLDLSGINNLLDDQIIILLNNLKTKLNFEEKNMFYVCNNNCGRFMFDIVSETDFLCPICGDDVVFLDNEKIRQCLIKRIKDLEDP